MEQRNAGSSVLVTGSADGIGRETAATLVAAGHRVLLHARNRVRGEEALAAVPGAAGVVTGDLASLASTRELAAAATAAGPFDVVIHNAGVGGGSAWRGVTEDKLERVFQTNVLAPYLLTALMPPPSRLIYLTSGLEAEGTVDLGDLQYERRPWDGMRAYADSKLLDVVLAFAVARRRPGTLSNAVDPGWIRTRLGGPNATGGLPEGAETQVWLATSDEPAATVTGRYFKHRRELRANPAASDEAVQDGLLAACAELTGVELPAG
ncbi:SDR family NAD(P)-dependent oxidoreductase [Streptomyces zingiberis]|uniref:SDR family NAD(P)-dependent oxidoreductase n=1 Tax=Streptomyces zingiberis TaxID=2053010 RepID=A0ABX1BRK9_9ACTN|nr:SDR family NAD(P)-dependent oxidoreductase [Streptomyces zingiberis]NJQ00366.1 SDR family NAD(P)-dependent oxidoreductase [Streptomyces zingiberis]